MRPISLLLAAAAATLVASAAAAQGAQQGDAAPQNGPAPSAGGQTSGGGAPLGSPDNPIPQSSPTPPDQAYHLKYGDPNVVSNAPVPDTPSNWAALGQPMSHAGKATPAAGN